MVDRLSHYKIAKVLEVEDLSNKPLKACQVDLGDDSENPITIVTKAANIRVGDSYYVIAPIGSIVEINGEEITVSKRSIGGRASHGVFCDAPMLGWSGGAAGQAVYLDEKTYELGSPPPVERPRSKIPQAATTVVDAPITDGLFAPKLSKEEKKRLAAEKRAAKKAAKEAASAKS